MACVLLVGLTAAVPLQATPVNTPVGASGFWGDGETSQALPGSFGLGGGTYVLQSSLFSLGSYVNPAGFSNAPLFLFSGYLSSIGGFLSGVPMPGTITSTAPAAVQVESAVFHNLVDNISSIPGSMAPGSMEDMESSFAAVKALGNLSGAVGGVQAVPATVPEPGTLRLLGCVIVAFSLMAARPTRTYVTRIFDQSGHR